MNPFATTVGDLSSLRWGIAYAVEDLSRKPQRTAISIGGTPPRWFALVAERLAELGALPTVDHYGSRPMNPYDVLDALNFMNRVMREETLPPWIGRLASGGVQLTWHVGDVEAEAVFDRARDERMLMVSVGENEWEEPVDNGDTLFGTVVDRLCNAHREHLATAGA